MKKASFGGVQHVIAVGCPFRLCTLSSLSSVFGGWLVMGLVFFK